MKFEKANLEVQNFAVADVITASTDGNCASYDCLGYIPGSSIF